MLQLSPLHTEINGLCLGAFELGLCQEDVGFGRHTGRIAIVCQVKGLPIHGGRGIKELFLSVQSPHQKIVGDQFRLYAQGYCCQIRGTGLDAGLAGFDAPADLTPQVEFPGCIQRQQKIRSCGAVAGSGPQIP